MSKDGFICFGDTVMLLSPDSESSVDNYTGACGNLTLAINLEEISIYSAVSLQAPCGVSAVKTIDPVGRNTFCLLRFGTFLYIVFNYSISFQYLILRNMQLVVLKYK